MFRHQGCEIPIFSQGEKILLVQSVHVAGVVVVDDPVGDDQGSAFVSCSKSIHTEARIRLETPLSWES